MSTVYPAQIDNSISLPPAIDNTTPITAETINQLRQAIIAIETELGVNPSASYTNVRTRLDFMTTGGGGGGGVSLAGDLGNSLDTPYVIGLQGRPLSGIAPTSGQVLSWSGVAWTPTNIFSQPGGTNRTIQFNDTGSFNGSNNITVSSDGYLQISATKFGGPATAGDVRLAYDSSIQARNQANNANLIIIKNNRATIGGLFDNILRIGYSTIPSVGQPYPDAYDSVRVQAKRNVTLLSMGDIEPSAPARSWAWSAVVSPGFITGFTGTGIFTGPNICFGANSQFTTYMSATQPFRGGHGILVVKDREVEQVGNPINAFDLWSDPVTHHPIVKLPNGIEYDLIGSNAATGDGYSVQYNLNGGFGGSSNVHISSDGYLQIGKNKTGSISTIGDIRLAKNSSIYFRGATKNVSIFNTSSDGYEIIIFGTDYNGTQADVIANSPKLSWSATAGNSDVVGTYDAGLFILGKNSLTSDSQFTLIYPNLALGQESVAYFGQPNPFNGGKGLLLIKDIITPPSASPINGFYLWSDATDHHPKVRLPNGSIYDLLAGTAGTPFGPDRSVQFNDSGAFNGSSKVSISLDGYLEIAADRAGGPAQTGDIRFGKSPSIKVRSSDGTKDLNLLNHFNGDNIFFGIGAGAITPDNTFSSINIYTRTQASIIATGRGSVNSNGYEYGGAIAFANGFNGTGTPTTSQGLMAGPNLIISPLHGSLIGGNQPFRDGYGIVLIKDRQVATSAPPTNGFDLWSDPTSHEPIIQLPNGTVKSVLPQGDGYALQYKHPITGGLAGAPFASINSDGYLSIPAKSRIATVDHLGNDKTLIRKDYYNITPDKVMNYIVVGDLTNTDKQPDQIYNRPYFNWDVSLSNYLDGDRPQGIGLFRANDYNSNPNIWNPQTQAFFSVYYNTNMAFFGGVDSINLNTRRELDGYGKGVIYLGKANIVPTTNPALGAILYTDPITYHPSIRLPNGNAGSLLPQGDGYSIQYKHGDNGVLAGAAHVSISNDGFLEISKDLGVADFGDLRLPKGFQAFARSALNTNLTFARTQTSRSNTFTAMRQGSSTNMSLCYQEWILTPQMRGAILVGDVPADNFFSAGVQVFAPGYFTAPDATNIRAVTTGPNLFLGYPRNYLALTDDPARGGLGYFVLEKRKTAAVGNPFDGYAWMYADETSFHPILQLPNGNTADVFQPNKLNIASLTFSGTDITLTSAQSEKQVILCDNGIGDIVAPNTTGLSYIVDNGSTLRNIKKSGGTGAACAASKRTTVYHNGTDYVIISVSP